MVERFIEEWGLMLGISALITFMAFIIWDLAKQSKAGRFGTVILFIGLGAGLFGFIIKIFIQALLDQPS